MFSLVYLLSTILFNVSQGGMRKGVRTDKILFTPVPVPRNGARVLPLEVVPVPGHCAQIFAWAPTIYYVQTRCPCPVLEHGHLV